MFEEANSAAALVTSVLETAGYVSQSHILQSFEQFWQKFGFLLYLISCAAGLISYILSGSFRGLRYLVIAPTLFYFAVMQRAPLDPAVWRFSNRPAEAVTDKFVGSLQAYAPTGPLEVSKLFAVYTRLTSGFISELTRVTMSFQEEDEFLFLARNQALFALLNTGPQKSEVASMLTYTLAHGCSEMIGNLVRLSGRQFSADQVNFLQANATAGDPVALQTLAAIQNAKMEILEKLNAAADQTIIAPDEGMRDFMVRQAALAGTIEGKDYPALFKLGGTQAFVDSRGSNSTLTCRQAFQVFEDAAMKDGTWYQKYLEEMQIEKSYLEKPEYRSKLCNAIATKYHKDYVEGPDCNLGLVSMIMLLRNRLHTQGGSAVVDAARTRMSLVPSDSSVHCVDRFFEDPADRRLKRDPGAELEFRVQETQQSVSQGKVLYARNKGGGEDDWCVAWQLDAPGMMATLVDQQHVDARGMLQQIYSFALNLPYYQGVALFWLAFSYPFMALFLLFPGKAQTFIYAPLAWVWVKSWDVGFAIVAVLDKMLWNLLPRSELPYSLSNPGVDLMPTLLNEVLRMDPTFDVHAHFNYVALAMLAVPTITGVIIMKGRTTVAAAVVTSANAIGREAKTLGARVSMQKKAHDRYQEIYDMQGMMVAGITGYGTGFSQNPELGTAARWGGAGAAVAGMSKMISRSRFGDNTTGRQTYVNDLLHSMTSGSKDAFKVFDKEVRAQAEFLRTFDPYFGIDGSMARRFRSNVGALDGDGSWEVYDVRQRAKKVWEKDLDSLMQKLEIGLGWGGDVLRAGKLRVSQSAPTVVGGAGQAVDGLLTGAAWGYAWNSDNSRPNSNEFREPQP